MRQGSPLRLLPGQETNPRASPLKSLGGPCAACAAASRGIYAGYQGAYRQVS
jgi:hypothetical protein